MVTENLPLYEPSLALRLDQPVAAVILEDDGSEVLCFFAANEPTLPDEAVVADALSLAGAWSDLDWEETLAALEGIRHATPPTPPIELDV